MAESNPNTIQLTVPALAQAERLDKWLGDYTKAKMPDQLLSRSQVSKLLEKNAIIVNGKPIKKNYKVKSKDVLVIDLSSIRASFAPVELKPVEGDLNIVYEDDHLVVINKMPGIAVHPGPAENAEDKVTLVQVLLHHFSASGLSTVGGTERPGIVHRLDQDTSGLMIVCKTDEAHAKLKEVFQRHDTNEIEKIYHAVVVGKMVPDSGSITARIMRHPKQGHKMTTTDKETEGKHALTFYETIKVIDTKTQAQYSLLQVKIATGRTHQIRVHVSSKAHPIVGDGLYSSKSGKYNVPYLLLVAKELRFKHPITGEKLDFEVEYPPHFQAFLDRAAL